MSSKAAFIGLGIFVTVLVVPMALSIFLPCFRKSVTTSPKTFPFEFITTWATFWGVFAAGVTLYFLYDEAELIKENQNAQAYANVYQSQLGLDQTEEQHPELTPYFEKNSPVPKDATNGNLIRMVAEHKLDVIDYFFSQQNNVSIKDDEFRAWIHYFKLSFSQSQVLCDVLRERHEVYGEFVLGVAGGSGCKGLPRLVQRSGLPWTLISNNYSKAADGSAYSAAGHYLAFFIRAKRG
jgi:hypothetical protein